jgi:hypothetical protein
LKHWLWLSLAILALDQTSKWMVLLALEPYEVIALMPNVNLTLMFNEARPSASWPVPAAGSAGSSWCWR